MATIITTSTGKSAPWRQFNKLSQEQVVGMITVLLLIVFAATLPGFATTQNILLTYPEHFHSRYPWDWEWGLSSSVAAST